ncbi:hypothetical protein B0H14DRAFT_213434 [Mycena olivaceomarginata]|nr:hypothetical protein B0H14DRAFT_213434 [Mycena olivaceomarginata]
MRRNSTRNRIGRTSRERFLRACILADRAPLASLSSGLGAEPYDASERQLDFVRTFIIDRRWALEEVASEMRALFRLVQSRTARTVLTPMGTKKSVVDQVRERDGDKCRLTGVERWKKGSEAEDQEARRVITSTLQVVHCLPFSTGDTSFHLIEALTGVKFAGWQADGVENALLTRPDIHELFAAFSIFFEWIQTPNGEEIIIRGRTGPASPVAVLRSLVNDRRQPCESILDTPLRPRHDTSIADLDPKYFLLHQYIGDIVWMSGGPEPVSDEEDSEDEDWDAKVLSDATIGAFIEKLHSPEMDMLPREREGVFRPRIQLVHKNLVWDE